MKENKKSLFKIDYMYWVLIPFMMMAVLLFNAQELSARVIMGTVDYTNLSSSVGKPSIYISDYNTNFQNGNGNYVGAKSWVKVAVNPKDKGGVYKVNMFRYGSTTSWGYKDSKGVKTKTYNYDFPVITFRIDYAYSNISLKPGESTGGVSIISGKITYPVDRNSPFVPSVRTGNRILRQGASKRLEEKLDGNRVRVTMVRQFYDDTWHGAEDIQYNVSCSDSESGCQKSVITETAKGHQTSKYVLVEDWAGTSEGMAEIHIKRDVTGPNGWYWYVTPTTWTRTAQLCGRCTSDAGVGCGYDRCTSVISNGEHTVCAQDALGNLSCKKAPVTNIDREAPSCAGITTPNGNYWYRTNFNVSSKCNDNGKSGCSKNPFTETKSTGSGSVTISDILGNSTTCAYSGVQVDTTAPTTTIEYGPAYTQNTSQMQSSDAQVEVIISAKDSQSGVDRVCYSLSGATSKGATCVNGSSTKIYISKEGTTQVTAWSFDKARNYNASSNSGDYSATTSSGGNKSNNATKNVWIDRTAPTIAFASTNDGKTWSNKVSPVTVSIKDDGSGIGYYRYYWSNSSSNAYDESTALYRAASGSVVNTDISKSWVNSKTFTETHPTNSAHNDVIYLHVKACDRSFYTNNCATATYKTGIHFDNLKPVVPNMSSLSQEWVNKYSLTIKTSEHIQTGKQNSGLNTIYTYWDTNKNHQEDGFTRENSTYATNANLTNANPSNKYNATYNWTIDFAKLKNVLKDGSEILVGPSDEGSRFIRVKVTDIAGNTSDYLTAGAFKWDTTSPKTEITDITSKGNNFVSAESQMKK